MKHLFNLLFDPDPADKSAGGGAVTSPPASEKPATPAATPPATTPTPAKVDEKPQTDPLSKAMDDLLDKDDKRQEDRTEAIRGVNKKKGEQKPPEEKKEEVKPAAEIKPEVKPPEVKPEEKKADLDTLITKLSEVIDKKAQPEGKKEEVIAPTPMQFYEATDAEVDALIEGGKPAKDVLTNLYKKAVIDAVTIVNTWAEQAIKPIQSAHQAQQLDAAKGRFFGKFPDLKPVENLALEVADKLVQQVNSGQRAKFKSEEELFNTVNEITSNYIKGVRAAAPASTPADTGGGATGVTKVETTDKGPAAKGPNNNGGARKGEGNRPPNTEDESLGNELLKERY